MFDYSRNLIPEIITATPSQDGKGFFVKYKRGREQWVAFEPYTEELYKQLTPYLGFS